LFFASLASLSHFIQGIFTRSSNLNKFKNPFALIKGFLIKLNSLAWYNLDNIFLFFQYPLCYPEKESPDAPVSSLRAFKKTEQQQHQQQKSWSPGKTKDLGKGC